MPADSAGHSGPSHSGPSQSGPSQSGPSHSARKAFYRVFYRLPGRWRRRLVRLVKQRYTIGSVVLVRTPGDDRLLLLRQPPGNGWSLPAGLLDRGERPVECAARELAEETGIRLRPDELTPATPNALVNRSWVDCVFLASVPADTAIEVDGAEVYEAAFYPVDALPPLTVSTARLLGTYGIGPYAPYPETRP